VVIFEKNWLEANKKEVKPVYVVLKGKLDTQWDELEALRVSLTQTLDVSAPNFYEVLMKSFYDICQKTCEAHETLIFGFMERFDLSLPRPHLHLIHVSPLPAP